MRIKNERRILHIGRETKMIITIAWDVDDVLNNLMDVWLDYYNSIFQTDYSFGQLVENPPNKILNISSKEYTKLLDEFRLSNFAKDLSPNLEIKHWMLQNIGKYRHIALTSTSAHTSFNSASWVFKNFYECIYSYNLVPAKRDYAIDLPYLSKKDFLSENNHVKILVDDNIKNIEDACSVGVKGFLLKKPWNDGMLLGEILQKIDNGEF